MNTFERNYYAKQLRGIRRILRGTEPVQMPDELQEDRGVIYSAAMVIGTILIACLMMISSCQLGHAYTIEELATAIGKAENSKSHPYGIMTRYWHTTPRQACINTIRHYLRNWRNLTQETGLKQAFLPYLASHYAPLGVSNDPNRLNRFWLSNVEYFLRKE